MSRAATMYHSELARGGEREISIRKVQPSNFPDKPPIAVIFDHTDNKERFYSTENLECEQFMEKWAGRRVAIKAGGRDDDAWIDIVEDLGDAEEGERRRDTRTATRGSRDSGRGGQRGGDRGGSSRGQSRGDDRGGRRDDTRNNREDDRDHSHERTERQERREPQAPPPEPPKATAEEIREKQIKNLRKAFLLGRKAETVMVALVDRAVTVAGEVVRAVNAAIAKGEPLKPVEPRFEDYRAILMTLFIEAKGHVDIATVPHEMPDLRPSNRTPAAPKPTEPARLPDRPAEGPPAQERTQSTEAMRQIERHTSSVREEVRTPEGNQERRGADPANENQDRRQYATGSGRSGGTDVDLTAEADDIPF